MKIRLSKKQIQNLIELYQSGLWMTQVAKRFGIHVDTVKYQLRKNNITIRQGPPPPKGNWKRVGSKGKNNGFWKGGRTIDCSGYVLVRCSDHPFANHGGYIREHRLVMEKKIGRYLNPKEVVHHINGNKSDNRIENLKLFSANKEHLISELTGRVPNWTEQGLAKMRKAHKKWVKSLRR